jgi:hypothetical protein
VPTFFFSSGSGVKRGKEEPKVFRQGAGVRVNKMSHKKKMRKIPVAHNGVKNPVIDFADDYDEIHVQKDFQQAHEEKLDSSMAKHGTIHPLVKERREREGADWQGLLDTDQLQSNTFTDARDKREPVVTQPANRTD